MKKKLGMILSALMMCLCLIHPDISAQAATGKTSLAVTSSSINIGDTVTVTARASDVSGETVYATMSVSYDASILEFVSCTATYGGGGGTVSASTDSFSITLKAIAAGKSAISLSATDGVVFSSGEELDSMEGSSTNITVNNAASDSNNGVGSDSNNGGTNTTTQKQSADNSLKTLTISPGTLSPAFLGSTTKYSATVANDVTSIVVNAIPVNEKATVESVTGNTDLAVGTNTISIVVKAENGTTATYKITVTRQAAQAVEAPEVEQPAEVVESETEEEPVTGETVTLNGSSYRISSELPEELPQDFTETTITYHETAYQGLSFNNGSLFLLYLVSDSTSDAAGKFAVYDETRDSFYDFVKLTSNNGYVIALASPVDYEMPENYAQTVFSVDGLSASAYQQTTETDEISDFYIFYGVNNEGTETWYQYDNAEGTYQRVAEQETSEDSTNSAEYESLQSGYMELSDKYTSEKSRLRTIIAILVFVIAVLVIVILNLILAFRRNKDDDDMDDDDFDEPEEKPTLKRKKEIEIIGTPEKSKGSDTEKSDADTFGSETGTKKKAPEKTYEKASENVLKKEPEKKTKDKDGLEVLDLNDL